MPIGSPADRRRLVAGKPFLQASSSPMSRAGPGELQRVKALEREKRELRRGKPIPRGGRHCAARCDVAAGDGARVARASAPLWREEGVEAAESRRVQTTIPEAVAERPRDLVDRTFQATRPSELWVADLTYVATRVRGVRHRRLLAAHCRLAGVNFLAQRSGARRAGASAL
jgi:transposase InsO family protein